MSQSISTQVYTSNACFLMELIQNADDNTYPRVTPALCITVTPEWVKIECKEHGFEERHIQTIYRTGKSSKLPGNGYIGEKGISFKSVFKIANRAHTRSRHFFYQLDKTRDLGMNTPIWGKTFFASHPKQYETTIILDVICYPLEHFATALENDLNDINPIVLLFLRVEELHLTLSHSNNPCRPPRIQKCFRRAGKSCTNISHSGRRGTAELTICIGLYAAIRCTLPPRFLR
jgi:hypothetical protein